MTNQRFATTISLVTYNGAAWLPFCLEALARSVTQDFFLMVIDNGSLDSSAGIVEHFLAAHPALQGRSRLVRNKQNLGFARAHNQALAWTDSDWVLLLNQDVVLEPSYLATCAAALTEHQTVAAVSGKLLRWNFDSHTFYLDNLQALQQESRIDSLGLKVHHSRRVTNLAAGEPDHGQYEVAREVFGVAGTAPVYRRAALTVVSLNHEVFDEDFVSYKEDVDLAWRLRRAGFTAWYLPQAVAYHDRSLGGTDTWREQVRRRARWPRELKVYSWVNHLGVLVKNDSLGNLAQDAPWVLAHEVKKAIFLLLTDPLTLAQSLKRLCKLLPTFLRKRHALAKQMVVSPRSLRPWWRTAAL